MNWKHLVLEGKWRLRHELFRRVLPRLQYDPFTIRRLSYKAWPIIAHLSAALEPRTDVETIDSDAFDENELAKLAMDRAARSSPIVFKQRVAEKIVSSWTLESIKSRYGTEIVTVRAGDYVTEFGQPQNCEMALATFLDYLAGEPFPFPNLLVNGIGPYVGNQRLPGLAAQLPQPELFNEDDRPAETESDLTTFWIGSAEASTPLHCHHFCDTLITQMVGARSVKLIAPHHALKIGYVPQNINIGMAAFDPFEPDKQQFPGDIDIVDIELAPGDTLLIPGFWFHAVRLQEPSMSSSWFRRSKMPAALGSVSVESWGGADPFVRGF